MQRLLIQKLDSNGALIASNLYDLNVVLLQPTFDHTTNTLAFPTEPCNLPPSEMFFVDNFKDGAWSQSEFEPFAPNDASGMQVDAPQEPQTYTVRLRGIFTSVISNEVTFTVTPPIVN